VLANSTGIYERLRRKYGVRAEKVIGGINLDVFTPQPNRTRSPDEYRVLVFGRLSRRKKGVPIALGAIESFAKRYRRASGAAPVKLVLFDHVGPGNEDDPRSAVRCEVPHEFHLNLSQDELAKLYAGCDVFVSAEKRAGWANTVAEAMACGVPVVCTRSGTRDVAVHRDTAWVTRWRHPWFIRRGLDAVATDPSFADYLRTRALAHIRGFSWSSVADQLETVVRKKLGMSPR
jgi:glycosyltransferase involved in cell wall biosynthesis